MIIVVLIVLLIGRRRAVAAEEPTPSGRAPAPRPRVRAPLLSRAPARGISDAPDAGARIRLNLVIRSSRCDGPEDFADGLQALRSLLVAASALLAGCGSAEPDEESASGKLRVVAAENFWGSIAAQLGGSDVEVQSIIVNPATDPHSYEPTAEDARTMAGAQMAIVNGIGYDQWASHLLAGDPLRRALMLDVGGLLGLKAGVNPHQWYSPRNVHTVIDQIVADYDKRLPADAGYFVAQQKRFETQCLARYNELIAQIRARYAGVPGRLQREHLPAARRSPWSDVADPLQLRQGGSRGRRSERPGQADR